METAFLCLCLGTHVNDKILDEFLLGFVPSILNLRDRHGFIMKKHDLVCRSLVTILVASSLNISRHHKAEDDSFSFMP